MGVAAFPSTSALQMRMLICPIEKATSHHSLTFPPDLKYLFSQ